MITPKYLKDNDVIGFTATSNGIVKEDKVKLLKESIKLLKEFNVIEDPNVYKSNNGESAPSKDRTNELIKLISNKDVNAIISVTGGNFLNEIFNHNDFEIIKKNPKWIQGQSDTTILLHYLTTKFNMKTIYSFNANALAKASELEFKNNVKILKGELIKQYDYNNNWKSNDNIDETGLIIGGTLECLIDIIGTKFDYTTPFLEKNKDQNIIWYFDIDYMYNEVLLRSLWHLNNAGWFKYTSLIIFGRSNESSYENIKFDDAVKRGLYGTNIKWIKNFDLGHTFPRVTIVNGSTVKVILNNNEHSIELLN